MIEITVGVLCGCVLGWLICARVYRGSGWIDARRIGESVGAIQACLQEGEELGIAYSNPEGPPEYSVSVTTGWEDQAAWLLQGDALVVLLEACAAWALAREHSHSGYVSLDQPISEGLAAQGEQLPVPRGRQWPDGTQRAEPYGDGMTIDFDTREGPIDLPPIVREDGHLDG